MTPSGTSFADQSPYFIGFKELPYRFVARELPERL